MIKEVTRDIFDPLWELGEGELDKQLSSTAFCSKHKDMCIFLKPVRPKALQLHVAGPSCIDWSVLGNGMQWLGDSMVPFACWVREQILCRPDVIVVENVQPFPAEELELIFAREYTLAAVCLSPDQLGVPCTRHRQYMILFKASRYRLHDAAASDQHQELLLRLFGGRCHLPGMTFWEAPADVVQDEHQRWADRKGLGRRLDEGSWKSKQLMSSGTRERLRVWEEALRKSEELTSEAKKQCIMNVTQTPERCPFVTKVPALTTHSAMFCVSKQRLLLHHEMLGVQGWPIFVDTPFKCHFRALLFSDKLSHVQWTRMAGNGMNLQCLGAALAFALGFLVPVQPAAVSRLGASSAAAVSSAAAPVAETQVDGETLYFEDTQSN